MRLGVLKNIIDLAVNEDNELTYYSAPLYGGQLFQITEYSYLIDALKQLVLQPWVDTEPDVLYEIISIYGDDKYEVNIKPEENSQIASLVSEINEKLPLFYGIIDEMVEEQDEQVINIKIPDDRISSLSGLTKFNKELEDIFKLIVKHKGLRSDVKFQGFDIGTSWYEILIAGPPMAYSAFLGVIDIAEGLIRLRKLWYESEDVKLSVEAKKRQLEKESNVVVTEDDMKEHISMLFKLRAEKDVQALIAKLPGDINDPAEMQVAILKGLSKVIELIERGTEFHPSLNPPDFVEEGEGQRFHIDYEKLKEMIEDQSTDEVPVQIEDQTEDNVDGTE